MKKAIESLSEPIKSFFARKSVIESDDPQETIPSTEQREFSNLLSTAKTILEGEHPEKIYDYIYMLGKPKQYQLIIDSVRKNMVSHDFFGRIECLFFKKKSIYKFIKYSTKGEWENLVLNKECDSVQSLRLDPKKTLIFPFTWNGNRFRSAFLRIGSDVGNPWEFDVNNHIVQYVKPLNIAIVEGGNHSMAINVMNNESSDVRVDSILDLSPVYEEVYTDGERFYRKATDIHEAYSIGQVHSVEMAAIFEIGRLLNDG